MQLLKPGFRGKQTRSILTATLIFVFFAGSTAFAVESSSKDDSGPPGAPRLLPSDTLVYVRLDNAEDLRAELGKSSIGRMINDPKMRPFADEFYATARDLFDQISDEVGVSLDELLAIPHGQVAFAIHPVKPLDEDEKPEISADDPDRLERMKERQRRREAYSFGFSLIVDAGSNIDQLMTIVDRLEKATIKSGRQRRVREIEKTEIVRLLPRRYNEDPIEFFQKDGTLVFGVGNSSAQDVLSRWNGDSDEPTLAENVNFGTIMSRCVGAEETRPQITFFIDPHAIIDRIIKRSGSFAAGMFWPVIEDLGASRFKGIGGSSFRGGDVFEGIAHYHIKINPPRDGVLGVLRPETGDTTPPSWVPENVAGYTSINWDIPKTYENLGKIIDRFQGEDSLKRFVEGPVEQRLGVSVQDDLLSNITGRMVRVVWMQQPIRLNSGVSVLALELKDPSKLKTVIASVRERMPNQINVDSVSGTVLYRLRSPNPDRFPKSMRLPEPCFMILGDWLIYADSTQFMEKAVLAKAGNLPRLIELPEYDLVTSELGGKLNGEAPFLLSFIDGVEGMRLIYDLAKDENSRRLLRGAGENNIVAKKFSELMDRNELPPFSEFEKYFAPTGMFGYDEPDGIHFGFFTLRAEGAK